MMDSKPPPKGFEGLRVGSGKRPPLDVVRPEDELERKAAPPKLWLPMGAAENFRCVYEQLQKHGAKGGVPSMFPVAVDDSIQGKGGWNLTSEDRGQWVKEQKEDATITRLLSGDLKMG